MKIGEHVNDAGISRYSREIPEAHANLHKSGWGSLQKDYGLVADNGSPRFSFHALRHSYANWLIDQDFAPKRVQTILGHSSIKTTLDTYGRLFPTDDRAYERLEAAETALRNIHATKLA